MIKRIIINLIAIIITIIVMIFGYYMIIDIETKIPQKANESCDIETKEFMSRKIFIIKPKTEQLSKKVILYFHGGAYVAEATTLHWDFLEKLANDTKSTIVMPDYPLTPKYTYKDVFNMVEPLYKEIISKVDVKNLVMMGDSAGGGITLALAEKISQNNIQLPSKTILISPWLNVTLTNEKIKEVFKGKKIMIISDDQVYPLYGDDLILNLEKDFKVNHVVVPHGEKSKRFDMLPTLYKACLDFKLTRTDLIIALGGGVIGDMAGFVASSYLRGVKLVQIPTSLLAQVDSSVGGKVAVDLPEGKNLVGAFYHPSMVLIDPCTLKTLDPHFISDGMGEVIKYGCIKDKKLFDQLNSYQNFEELYEFIDEIIYNCVNIKREVVEKDQFDFGDRLLLNFGHTYAHAIEQYYHYEKYSHGEAVGIGMYQITKLAESLDLTKTGSSMQIKEILQKYNLPYECQVETKNLIQAISLDKKNINNSLSVVLLKEIGDSYVYQTNQEFLLKKERV